MTDRSVTRIDWRAPTGTIAYRRGRAHRLIAALRKIQQAVSGPVAVPALEHFPDKWAPVFRRKCDLKPLGEAAITDGSGRELA
jgi:hypothetical protein